MSTRPITGGADGSVNGDARRDAVLIQARRTFLSQGFAAAHMEQIARLARVSTATLYGFFPSKDALFEAVIEYAVGDFACCSEAVSPPPGPVRERLTVFATAYARFIGDAFVHEVFRLVLAERARFGELAMRVFGRGRAEIGAGLIRIIAEARESGELTCEQPARAASQLLGMIDHPLFFVPLFTGEDENRLRLAAAIANDAVDTFLARYGA